MIAPLRQEVARVHQTGRQSAAPGRQAARPMVNSTLARDSPDFQPYPVAKQDIGSLVRFDARHCPSYLLAMSKTGPNTPEHAAPGKALSPAAKRALEEAAKRRRLQDATERPTEKGGPSGEEPTRYGDWERGGIAYDF